ncbi:MAG TPA: T9SS type A sorting domain-containing protein, partial [Saprospiraceae bacterium]|nr:T9SS type A sorting domain-containing protein [Saprospiraceae bacterium]
SIEVRDTNTTAITCRNIEKTIDPTGTVFVNARELVGFFGSSCLATFSPRVVMARLGHDTVQSKTYTCDDLVVVGQELVLRDTVSVQVYDGNTLLHSCNAVLTIRGGANCQNFFFITSSIKTSMDEVVPDFSISLVDEGRVIVKSKTDQNGKTTLTVPSYKEMMIVPSKNDDYLNGVNTLDLVQIQRHILGINRFKSPYQMIAADVNNDKKISVSDIVEVRNLILGIKEKFDNHTSWIAIDGNYKFYSVEDALDQDYPQYYELNPHSSDMHLDFIGVKIGDVDVSYSAQVYQNQLIERNTNIFLILQDQYVQKGEKFSVTFPFDLVEAIGADLLINLNGAELLQTIGADWLSHIQGQNLKMINYNGIKTNKVTLHLKATRSSKLSDIISIEKSEIYSNDLTRKLVSWQWENVHQLMVENAIKVFPNPMTEKTTLQVSSTQNEQTNAIITDLQGKTIASIPLNLTQGINTVSLERSYFNNNGIYFLALQLGDELLTTKIIVTE